MIKLKSVKALGHTSYIRSIKNY